MKNKKAFEMSFAWIFSIIVGALILFIAIYATSKFISTRRFEIDTQTAAKLAILIDPLETSIEAGKSSVINFNKETRIYNSCSSSGNFGRHLISLSSKSGIGKDWLEPGAGIPINNKYIFSEDVEQGKEFSVFSMPFEMPFKVSDLIFISGKKYCFIRSPNKIKDDIQSLNLKNIELVDLNSNCSQTAEKVCFNPGPECDIEVYSNDLSEEYNTGQVVKNSRTMYFTGPLIYGAIFSSPEVYECNTKRLMLRLKNLGEVYQDKIRIIEKKGCNSNLEGNLNLLTNLARNLDSSQKLFLVQEKADEIKKINEGVTVCGLW